MTWVGQICSALRAKGIACLNPASRWYFDEVTSAQLRHLVYEARCAQHLKRGAAPLDALEVEVDEVLRS